MELKYTCRKLRSKRQISFNRTFMELKFDYLLVTTE